MAWQDRIIQAAYVSPSGQRFLFQYEDVSHDFTKNIVEFNFPDGDGTFIQDLGRTGRRIPLKVIFWGDDYDLQANAFEAAISEVGPGKLEHPIYGIIDVVPSGVARTDKLKTAANQAILTITFFETTDLIFPASQQDAESEVFLGVDAFNIAVSEQFNDITVFPEIVSQVQSQGKYKAVFDETTTVLQPIANTDPDIKSKFDSTLFSIDSSLTLSDFFNNALTAAFQTTILIQEPARAIVLIEARLKAYGNLLDSILETNFLAGLGFENSNNFHIADLYAATYITGSILSVLNNTFEFKKQTIEAAEVILNQIDEWTAWRDIQFATLDQVDTGEAYHQLVETASLAAGFLVEISFVLKLEKIFTLDRDRQLIELVAELYGNIDDDTLNFFIDSNNLSGSEILELRAGRQIVYYV